MFCFTDQNWYSLQTWISTLTPKCLCSIGSRVSFIDVFYGILIHNIFCFYYFVTLILFSYQRSVTIFTLKCIFIITPSLDFERKEPPLVCGQTDDGRDKVCCHTQPQRTRTTPEKKYG